MDPGTALAVVSLALQVLDGLHKYYQTWKGCDEDVQDLQDSLLRLQVIFDHLRTVLQKPTLTYPIVSTICQTCETCLTSIDELNIVLRKIVQNGSAKGWVEKIKLQGRRACYPFRASMISRLAEIVEDLKDGLSLCIQILSLGMARNTVADNQSVLGDVYQGIGTINRQISYVINEVDVTSQNLLREKIWQWLSPPDHSSAHNLAVSKCQSGTGGWFINSETFTNWRSLPHSRLWVYGNVGSGKTILCSTIVESLLSSFEQSSEETSCNLAYFYFSFDNSANQQLDSLVASILCQICRKKEVPLEIKKLYQRRQPERPRLSELLATLIAVLKRFSGKADGLLGTYQPNQPTSHTYLVFDGLDEIPHGSQREGVLQLLHDISISPASECVHILVTGRGESDISAGLPASDGWLRCGMFQRRVLPDIAAYVTSQIEAHQKLSHLSAELKDLIQDRLVKQSNGMFRWAALQMEDLKQLRLARPYDVLRVLNSLPKDLDSTYDRIISKIDSLFVQEVSNALQWLTFAARPLFIEEVAEACIIETDSPKPVDPDRRMSPSDIADILSGLVVIEPKLPVSEKLRPRHHILVLAHFSVKEYLLSDRGLGSRHQSFAFNSTLCHQYLLRSCMAYITHCSRNPSDSPTPFSSYACNRWTHHWPAEGECIQDLGVSSVIPVLADRGTCEYWLKHSRLYWLEDFGLYSDFYATSPYYGLDISRLLDFYLLFHAVVFELKDLVHYLLQSTPLLLNKSSTQSTTDVEFTSHCKFALVNAAVFTGNIPILRSILGVVGCRQEALMCALEMRKDDIALEVLASYDSVGTSELEEGAYCGPVVLATLLDKFDREDTLGLARALEAATHFKMKRDTLDMFLQKLVSFDHDHQQEFNSMSLFGKLVLGAIVNELDQAAEVLLLNEARFSPGHSIDELFSLAITTNRDKLVRAFLDTPVRSQIKYTLVNRAAMHSYAADQSKMLSVLLEHIREGPNVASKFLRASIAQASIEASVIRLLNMGAGRSSRGKWTDYQALLMAVMTNKHAVVLAMGRMKANLRLCRTARYCDVGNYIAGQLYSSGARFILERRMLTAINLWYDEDVYNLRLRDEEDEKLLHQYQLMAQNAAHQRWEQVKWSLTRLVEVVERTFQLKHSGFMFGSDVSQDLMIFNSDQSTPALLLAWQNTPSIIVLRYKSKQSSETWEIFQEKIPNGRWVAAIYDVELLDQHETAWEESLELIPDIEELIYIVTVDGSHDEDLQLLELMPDHNDEVAYSDWSDTLLFALGRSYGPRLGNSWSIYNALMLAHFSAKEYLLSDNGLSSEIQALALNSTLCHQYLLRSFMAYVNRCSQTPLSMRFASVYSIS